MDPIIICVYTYRLATGEITTDELMYVYYCSINFRDVMLGSGKLSTDVVARGRLDQVTFFYSLWLIP